MLPLVLTLRVKQRTCCANPIPTTITRSVANAGELKTLTARRWSSSQNRCASFTALSLTGMRWSSSAGVVRADDAPCCAATAVVGGLFACSTTSGLPGKREDCGRHDDLDAKLVCAGRRRRVRERQEHRAGRSFAGNVP